MQALNAPPRAGMDPARVDALLHADDLTVAAGVERVDNTGAVVDTLDVAQPDGTRQNILVGGTVSWDGSLDVQRECSLVLTADLRWDCDRVRVWMDLSSDTAKVKARWWLGVFVLHTASTAAGAGDERTVAGLDLLSLLACPIGNTWSVRAGDNVLAACYALVAATSFGSRVAFDSTSAAATFRTDKSWPLIPSAGSAIASTTWLQVLSEMLASIGYEKPWVDESGQLRSRPLVPVAQRATEYVLDADDARTTILGPARGRTQDLMTVPNAWIFVAQDWDLIPTAGDGLYLPPDNTSTGPTSITARNGHRVVAVVQVPAQTQNALVAQATARIESDVRAAAVRDLQVNPLPGMGQDDLYLLRDAELGATVRAVATRWTVDVTGADGPLTLEEVPA